MFTLVCRQRGCTIDPAESVPELCPCCGNPLIAEDQQESLVDNDDLDGDNDSDVGAADTDAGVV